MKKYLAIILLCMSCGMVMGQAPKKILTPADYHLWSKVSLHDMSPNGSWVSYQLTYDDGADTLFVRSKDGKKVYDAAKGFDGKFFGEHKFVCRVPGDSLIIFDLFKGNRSTFSNVTQYGLTTGNKFLAFIEGEELYLMASDGKIRYSEKGVFSFVLNPEETAMAYNSKNGVTYLDISTLKTHRLASVGKFNFTDIAWQQNGNSFAFMQHYEAADDREGTLSLYRIGEGKRYDFDQGILMDLLGPKASVVPYRSKLKVSDDGTKVYFAASANNPLPDKSAVQIYNASDRINFYASGTTDYIPRVFAWWPDQERYLQLTDHIQSGVFLTGDEQFAVTYDMKGTVPQAKLYTDTDYYLTELATGKRSLFLTGKSSSTEVITASPAGKYIAYINESSWWVYNIITGDHQDLGSLIGIESALPPEKGDFIRDFHSIAGWTEDDAAILITDKFDIWQIDLTTMSRKRLTNGRENGTIYRPHSVTGGMYMQSNWDGLMMPIITKEPLLLKGNGDKTKDSGFFVWQGKLRKLIYESSDIPHLTRKPECDIYYYLRQKFDSPPAIHFIEGLKSPKLVFQSNPQHKDFHYGRAEVINYENSHGVTLQGALYYPANYDPEKQYPMVVYIYEKLSRDVHKYVSPTLYNNYGFNISNLVSQGYFVLCPDIEYISGDVGKSAADCTIEATKSIIDTGMVYPERIALVGHSFGGFEVSFIMTQTDMFTTAVAGSAITDFVSSNLGMGGSIKVPDTFRFEVQQFRMGRSLYEDMEGYIRNSPVLHAEKINRPILIFTGGDDRQVDPRQSMELYLAMWRLQKKGIMLSYPGEGHIMFQKHNKADLTLKIEQWLGYFLKEIPVPDWMRSEFN